MSGSRSRRELGVGETERETLSVSVIIISRSLDDLLIENQPAYECNTAKVLGEKIFFPGFPV